jgi:hypothetical protein
MKNMMLCDAIWLRDTFTKYSVDEISPLLNLGSSTREFREIKQPFVYELVFAPLLARGVRIIHSDLKEGDGVDIATDIFDESGLEKIKAEKPRCVLCTHMFEHVENREKLAEIILKILPSKGLFFVTVPHSYHYHADPIDTMYRPTPNELANLFHEQLILEKAVLTGDNYWTHIKKRPFTLFLRHFARFFTPFLGIKKWKRSMRKLYWLVNNYKVSAIVGQKL